MVKKVVCMDRAANPRSGGFRSMFFLAEIQENIRLPPGKLRYDFVEAVTDALNQKFCNKVRPSPRPSGAYPA